MEKPRRISRLSEGSSADDVSWDELGDAVNIGLRQSMKPSASNLGGHAGGSHRPSACAAATVSEAGHESPSTSPDEEFDPTRLQSRGNTKLNHSLRVSDTGWDDLEDEIAKALKESMIAEEELEEEGPWNCPACTFLNDNPLHLVCSVCGTAKVASKLAPPAATAKSLPVSATAKYNNDNNGLNGSITAQAKPRRHSRHSSSEDIRLGSRDRQSSTEDMGSRKSPAERLKEKYSEDADFRKSFNSRRSHTNNGHGNNDDNLRSSATSHNSRGAGGGRQQRRGVRRGQNRDNLDSSFQSSVRTEQSHQESADSFGSFNSKDHQLHKFKPQRGNNGRRSADSKRFSKSMSSDAGDRGSSHRRHDRDDMSRSSRRSSRGGSKAFRRSATASMGDYGDINGYGSHDSDSISADMGIGGKIDALSSESECSELSDEGTHYRDDRTARTMRTVKTLRVPEGEVTIIYTDVQGSTSLWEADPLAMKKSTDIHDQIIRKCYSDHGGYEITTEGDAFNLAFQHPADAIGFAIKAQLNLYRAKWPEGILNHPDGCDNDKKKFRGFRVRFGMAHGPTTSTVHETTGRTIYQGEAVDQAKAIEKMSHGGQILTTVETWRTVSGMAEQFLGSPQVMDCGEHLLYDPKKEKVNGSKKKAKRIISKRIVQLVPNSLSYDFFAARGGQEVKEGEVPPRVCGRVFPPLLSHGQLSTSFLNAPYIGNKVAMVFVYTDKMESINDRERKRNYKILSKYVRSHLMRLSPPGYECQEDKGSWMLAFDRIENGIKFGLALKDDVVKNSDDLFGKVDTERVFRIGIHWGPFLSMGPHTVSGHADYFGPIVNRAARVAAQCEAGQICVGVPMGDGEEPPDPGPSVDVDVLGVKQLKGISIEMAIFACRRREKKKPTP
mmetsp:Transcript_14281/g.30984  ORF Transcript_14281/g.30984 Transcript_14281/m.30984 type:complete len:893 (-) Transcript_14281:422-3100(-)|eukprot:CAMPEP_0172298512 /NCGR_PEP_ID=MMETSP1058-20130122/1135_1 /TAXON_ID=83371 /ORGANISM="Detonula confervacea, Strain CCMP 353" /LENGTH=892 /DNA_ID=CAMNT_0013007789 /DNA_START=165 /DNA_END=2843 /DNA_ORIENTATION=+